MGDFNAALPAAERGNVDPAARLRTKAAARAETISLDSPKHPTYLDLRSINL